MIVVLNEQKTKLEFQSYKGLFDYIKAIENQKLLGDSQEEWKFVVHSPERLSAVYKNAIKAVDIFITRKEKEAYETGLNLLEMYKGDCDAPTQIILSPDINLNEMRKSWCRDYCLEHGYTISEK